jgi:hypothetical protein
LTGILLPLVLASTASCQQKTNAPLPDIRQLMSEVQAHQKQLEQVRENYTYSSLQTTQDVDQNGTVTKTESEEGEDFFVNGHVIERRVKKNGRPLEVHDEQKEGAEHAAGSAAGGADGEHKPCARDHGRAQSKA